MSNKLINIHNDFHGYNELLKFYNINKDKFFDDIEVILEEWFDANLSALLGGTLDKIQNDGLNSINFIYLSPNIQTILQKNNFLSFYGYNKRDDTYHSTIEYKKFKPSDSRYFHQYLEDDLLNHTRFPNMSDVLHEKISESIHEMFVNAQIHSETDFIYTCGQYFYQRNEINFTIVDTGIGFAKRIQKDLGFEISSSQAITWAMIDGNTTKQGVSGGLGLIILKEFIMNNQGKIQIVSGDAFYELQNKKENIKKLDAYLDGSVISMTFKTNDTKTYNFSDEKEKLNIDDIF